MHIPRVWVKTSSNGETRNGRVPPVTVWGWGEDEKGAKERAADRLRRLLERICRGDPFPGRYVYGVRPLREEILHTIEGSVPSQPVAILTRNSYGVQVLNTARLLFLDIDLKPRTFLQRILGMLGAKQDSKENRILARIRETLQQYGQATFRIYRTAAGFRIMAIDREFDPAGRDAQELMIATGTDPAFSNLCRVQRSFRARLTPKPWRCGSPLPPSEHPRIAEESIRRFESWLSDYGQACTEYATCRYIETIGSGSPRSIAGELLELHDRQTRCSEPLPLA